MGITAEPLHQGSAGTLLRAQPGAHRRRGRSGRRCSAAAAASRRWCPGAALVAGSACTRFGIFEAGQASARDPRYTVVPQRERLERRQAEQAAGQAAAGQAG